MLLKIFCRYTLIQVLQKAKATFSRKESEQDGIFSTPHSTLWATSLFWKAEVLIFQSMAQEASCCERGTRAACPLKPGLSHLASRSFQRGNHISPVMTATAPNSSWVSKKISALNLLTWLHQDNKDPEIPSCSFKGKVGEKTEIENSACLRDSRLPHTSLLPAVTQTDHYFIAVIISPQVLNTLEVLSIHSTQSNSTHLRYWEDNSCTFKSF